MSGAEQRPQRWLERSGPKGGGRRQDGQCVAGLGEADTKAVVSQRPGEAGEAPARRRSERLAAFTLAQAGIGVRAWTRDFLKVTRHHATLPRSRALTSRVTRA